jgi:drug/metabolite transporter (DMT)-like permease
MLMIDPRQHWLPTGRGALLGLAAAALFGLSAPIAKILLGSVPPVLLAGLLYLGAALGLWLQRIARPATREAPLASQDAPLLIGIIASGGVLGPVLMLLGLSRVSALVGSLLLNLEAPFTVLLALVVFREHLGRYAAIATTFIIAGAGLLKLEPSAGGGNTFDTLGVALLASACLCWAVDNNLTQRLSLRDPFAIVRVKTLAAGIFNTSLGIALAGGRVPELRLVAAALGLGSLSYGVSVVLDAYALRLVGAAREAAYFATAPFIGAIGSWALLHDRLTTVDVAAMSAMACGVGLLLRERHAHLHQHQELEHEHLHSHDEHHRHGHRPSDPPGDKHSHRHRHAQLVHDHPHVPDAHHRHQHR